MDQVVYCSVSYLIDFIKLFSAAFLLFDFKTKSKINTAITSLLMFVLTAIISIGFDLSQ